MDFRVYNNWPTTVTPPVMRLNYGLISTNKPSSDLLYVSSAIIQVQLQNTKLATVTTGVTVLSIKGFSLLYCHTLYHKNFMPSLLVPEHSEGRQRHKYSHGAKWSSAPYPAKRLVFNRAAPPFRSGPYCVFVHIYCSLSSQIARLCYIWNIKHSAIRRDVFDTGTNTLSLQTQFESTYTQFNRVHTAASMNLYACAECISRQMESYKCTISNCNLYHVHSIHIPSTTLESWTSSPLSSIYNDQLALR